MNRNDRSHYLPPLSGIKTTQLYLHLYLRTSKLPLPAGNNAQ